MQDVFKNIELVGGSLKDLARFIANIDQTDSCWNWKASSVRGYGRIEVNKKAWRANRLAFVLAFGIIPPGLHVLHHCDNPSCVRPDHLWLGTNIDNVADRQRKRRTATGNRNGSVTKPERRAYGERNGSKTKPDKIPRGDRNGGRTKPETRQGERHWKAKLTRAQVIEIRRQFSLKETNSSLAKQFNVSRSVIQKITSHTLWKSV